MGILVKGNDYKFFDKILDIYKKQSFESESAVKTKYALQAFLQKPKLQRNKQIQAMKKQIQAVGVSTDFPLLTKDSFNVTIEMDNYDLGFEEAFKQVKLGKGKDSWEIYNVGNSLNFSKIEEGQRIEVAGLSGSKTSGEVDYYGGAIGWTDRMIRFRKVPAMIEMAEIFKNKFWVNKANNHYALIAAAAALNLTAYQGVAGDGQGRRDVLTINQAAYDLTNRNKNKGYGDMANAPLILYANPNDEERIEGAFKATSNAFAAGLNRIEAVTSRRIKRIYTYNESITAQEPILALPGRKIQKADVLQPKVYNQEQDMLTLNRVQAVWAIYGAIVADTDQCQTIMLH